MIYAKSDPKETLREHTDELKKELEILKKYYGNKIDILSDLDKEEFWRLLDIIVEFHDLGKVFTPFQNVIREKIGEKKINTSFENDVYHNFISPAFINYKKLNIDKELKELVVQSIGYHHERDVLIDGDLKNKIQKILDEDIVNKVEELKDDFHVKYEIKEKSLKNTYLKHMEKRISPDNSKYKDYILLKGLTHRIDHSASAHEDIELNPNENVGRYTEVFFEKNNYELKPVQQFAKDNRDKNIILKASTGMGKTETALIWIDNDKAFFTLPLRVSINALFDRVSKDDIKYNYAGLLHSSSLDYLEENKYDDYEDRVNQSRLMSTKLTFSTIDQIFKFPFMYRGYEKEYATLAYSKIVIDEIQAYSPEICAVLIKGIEMIHKIGGKFMIMTATMPAIYEDELEERGVIDKNLVRKTFNIDKVRHNVKIEDESLGENLDQIVKEGHEKKVLIIVNTVKSAIETYEKIKLMDESVNLNMLHSMYIQEDRAKLESNIKDFATENNNNSGIWITTQLVEASLDVDFDVLHTEVSTLDSLFQRFGRCNRKGRKPINNPNIFIYKKDATGIGSIYDEEIVNKGMELLQKCITENSSKITEEDKLKMVETVYSKENLSNTKFFDKFKKALDILDALEPGELSKSEAQSILRDIESDTAIPVKIYEEIKNTYIKFYEALNELIDVEYKKENRCDKYIKYLKKQRQSIKRDILKKTVNIPTYKTKNLGVITDIPIKGLENIKILNFDYELEEKEGQLKGRGVLISEKLMNFI
ncbi:CRISPR-associated helicase Cas3' [Terrisporobacter sp.]